MFAQAPIFGEWIFFRRLGDDFFSSQIKVFETESEHLYSLNKAATEKVKNITYTTSS